MPKAVQKQGYLSIEPTKGEQFADFFNGIAQGLQGLMQQQMKAKQDAADRVRQVKKEQADYMLSLAGLADKDPDLYNEFIARPQVRDFMDPARITEAAVVKGPFEKFTEKRAAKKLAAAGPPPPEAMPGQPMGLPGQKALYDAPMAKGTIGVAEKPLKPDFLPKVQVTDLDRLKKAAQASGLKSQMDQDALNSTVAKYRQGLMSYDDAYSEIQNMARRAEGATGQAPSMDAMSSMYYRLHPEELEHKVRVETPGTMEWKRIEAQKMAADATRYRKGITPGDLDQIKQWSEWQVGLLPNAPPRLPPAYQTIESDLAEKGYQLRQKEYNINAAQFELMKNKNYADTAMMLQDRGMDPKLAQDSAETLFKTGKLPPGVVMPPNRRLEMDLIMDEKRGRHLEAEIKTMAVKDPAMSNLFKLVSQLPVEERTPGHAMFDRLVDEVAKESGWGKEVITHWFTADTSRYLFPDLGLPNAEQMKAGQAGAAAGGGRSGGPGAAGAPPAPAPAKQASEPAKLTPELTRTVMGQLQAFETERLPTADPLTKAKFGTLTAQIADAYQAGDAAAMLRAQVELQKLLGK